MNYGEEFIRSVGDYWSFPFGVGVGDASGTAGSAGGSVAGSLGTGSTL